LNFPDDGEVNVPDEVNTCICEKPPAGVDHVGAPAPEEVKTCPDVPAAENAGALEPAEYKTPPADPADVVAY
jgi:hypothetical protein